jgi:hypothetical protein
MTYFHFSTIPLN